jgi:hypothetical protein
LKSDHTVRCGRAGPPRFMPGGSIRLNSVGFT